MERINNLTTPVHLRANNPNATRRQKPPEGQAFPIFDGVMPFNNRDDYTSRIDKIKEIINFLKVSNNNHLRYNRTSVDTFCNIYAYDLCYLMGEKVGRYYMPRVWWTDKAISDIKNGHAQNPVYITTVREMNANALHQWFKEYGAGFGWSKIENLTEMQNYVNTTGHIGIIVGKNNQGRHGHITVVVPEVDNIKAVKDNKGNVINPLQSQAGATNFEYGPVDENEKQNPWFAKLNFDSSFYISGK